MSKRTIEWSSGFVVLLLTLTVGPASGQQVASVGPSPGKIMDWMLLVGVGGALWFLFYMGLYPLLLRHYRADYCKLLFWSLFLLYALAWIHLSLYVVFDIGFFYPLIRWIAAFLASIWLITFVIVLARHRTS